MHYSAFSRILICAAILEIVIACGGSAGGGTTTTNGGSSGGSGGGTPSNQIRGITIDDIENIDDTVNAIRGLSTKPMTRLVMDPGMAPSEYTEAVTKLKPVSSLMAQPVDSDGMKNLTTAQYRQRFTDYLNAFPNSFDIWEVANELNGEWTGPTAGVVEKLRAGYDETRSRGQKTAITLYYNIGCSPDPARQMLDWARTSIPSDIKGGVDYVLISFYPDDCNGANPSWTTIFSELSVMFPKAMLGFGEIGTEVEGKKEQMIREYYSMPAQGPRYIGGYFWWWFKQDAVPTSKPLYKVFKSALTKP